MVRKIYNPGNCRWHLDYLDYLKKFYTERQVQENGSFRAVV